MFGKCFRKCHVTGLVALTLAAVGCRAPKSAQSAGPPPPVPVSVAIASQESVPLEIRAVGTVEASAIIQVKSQVSGELMRVRFIEGGNVNKGDLLFEIDPRPYQQALRQAEGSVARDQAQLRQAQANLGRDIAQSKNADSDAARYDQLSKEGIVSKTQNDQFRTTADALRESIRADQAAIESARASLESDRAAVDRAKLDLSYCEIRSPVAGRAGNLLVHAGNLVQANGANALVVINQLTPIFVSFGAPEEFLAAVRRNSAMRKLAVAASPQDDPGHAARGLLTVIDNTVDTNTGTIRLKATFDNKERLLWPGQFVNVALTLETQKDAVVVPTEAVLAGQRGQMIYVVKADKTVEPRVVTVGASHGNKTVVEKGVAAGETVVTDGQLRLFPGARIQPVPVGKIDSQTI
ncbi:MAG: efflux RND transporter periplasmic adaptor subunit [Acidobacteriota bacterium]|nr:efflux RND transporter periplasmic adaptor subunit [Acidobacteriota bacterium]